ncbi:hypothetical protein F4803DRAFT_545541 [Xylaria telfairii]|nr:hypothetical protein F4803DRAFT_545541 [Xylaria telfairii]
MVNDTNPRDQYPSRPAVWHPVRMGSEYYSEDGRLAESPEMRGRPWTINRGLTEICGIPGRTFFVAAEDNGRVICLSTPFGSSQLDHDVFFNSDAFIREVVRVQQAPIDNQSFNEPELAYNTGMSISAPEVNVTRTRDRHQYPKGTVDNDINGAARRSKKRPRASSKQRGGSSIRREVMSMGTLQPRKGIRIGDSDAVYAFYDHRLKCCQQTACKIIAKAWVKAVAPRKQTTNPYTRGDKTRPDWWPKTYCRFGEDTYKDLRHKEPDHLGKEERVFLLCHILRLLVEPVDKQHPAIRKVNLDLNTLEKVTFEAMSSWLNDKDSPANGEKKSFLKELFKVAKQEARYRDNELDGNTEVFVRAISSDEAGKDVPSDSDDESNLDHKFTPDSSVEPNGQIMMSQVQVNEHRETGHFAGNSFPEHVPMHTPQYSHHGFEPELSERTNYVEAPGIGTHAPSYSHSHIGLSEMYPSPQGTSRRSSVFNSPSEYGSPTTPVMYSPWSSSNTASNAPIYGFQSQQHSVQAFGGQMAQGPSYTAPSIDGALPRPGTEVPHGDIFGSRGVGQGAMHHQSSFPGYVAENASLVGPAVKTEGEHDPSIPQ